jgi:hypothetical protein
MGGCAVDQVACGWLEDGWPKLSQKVIRNHDTSDHASGDAPPQPDARAQGRRAPSKSGRRPALWSDMPGRPRRSWPRGLNPAEPSPAVVAVHRAQARGPRLLDAEHPLGLPRQLVVLVVDQDGDDACFGWGRLAVGQFGVAVVAVELTRGGDGGGWAAAVIRQAAARTCEAPQRLNHSAHSAHTTPTEEGQRRAPRLLLPRVRERRDHVAGGLGLPPRVDDGAAAVADDVVVPWLINDGGWGWGWGWGWVCVWGGGGEGAADEVEWGSLEVGGKPGVFIVAGCRIPRAQQQQATLTMRGP